MILYHGSHETVEFAEVDIPIPMILWKVLWRMTRFIIIFRISWMGEYQERLFGSW